MENKEYIDYQILRNIEIDEAISQRKLSETIGINVSSVNFALKKLIARGWVKMNGINPRRITYLITPNGIAEKSELALNHFKRNYTLYSDVTRIIESKLKKVKNGKTKIGLFGKNQFTEIAFHTIQKLDISFKGVFVEDIGSEEDAAEYFPTYSLSNIEEHELDYLLVFSEQHEELLKKETKIKTIRVN